MDESELNTDQITSRMAASDRASRVFKLRTFKTAPEVSV